MPTDHSDNQTRDAAAHPADMSPPDHAARDQTSSADQVPAPRRRWRTWLLVGIILLALVGFGLTRGRRWVINYLNTVSTDDAFVNGHVSSISTRISGQVVSIYVDDNQQVKKGDLLLELDPEPYRVDVALKKAALEVAESNLRQAMVEVRALEAQARSSWFSLVNAQEQVEYQIATLRTDVADLKLRKAQLTLARRNLRRIHALVPSGAESREREDQAIADEEVARQRVTSAEANIVRDRAALGLPPNADDPTQVPKDLEENFSTVQTALSKTAQMLAEIGMPIKLHKLTPKTLHRELMNMSPDHDLNQTLDQFVAGAPGVLVARAKVDQAKADLRNSELNLSYTSIYAPIDGMVSNRTVNPGNNVTASQALMALRSLEDIWIDANFKETELYEIRIGHPVTVTVDAYPGKMFQGRISGFSAGTGSSLSLLPPENATGNYVKIVQRLPVRVTLLEPNPPDTPLLIGLSVVPTVHVKEQPTGPNAGQRLMAPLTPGQPATNSTSSLPSDKSRSPGPGAPAAVKEGVRQP